MSQIVKRKYYFCRWFARRWRWDCNIWRLLPNCLVTKYFKHVINAQGKELSISLASVCSIGDDQINVTSHCCAVNFATISCKRGASADAAACGLTDGPSRCIASGPNGPRSSALRSPAFARLCHTRSFLYYRWKAVLFRWGLRSNDVAQSQRLWELRKPSKVFQWIEGVEKVFRVACKCTLKNQKCCQWCDR